MQDDHTHERSSEISARVKAVAEKTAGETPDTPDEQTKSGLKKEQIERRKAKTPSDRADEMFALLLAHKGEEIDRLRLQSDHQSRQLGTLSPRNASLEEAARNARRNGWQSAAMMAIGSGLISTAPLPEADAAQYAMMGGGWSALVWGAILLAQVNIFGWPKNNPN